MLLSIAAALLLSLAPPQADTILSVADARADFDVLRSALEEAHGGLYRFATKAEVDARFNAYRARLTSPISKRDYTAFIATLLATTRDGHTRLEYDSVTTAALTNAPLFPLRVVVEGNKLIVQFNDTPADSTILPGMEVVSVNGRPVSDVLTTMRPMIPGDGFIPTGRATRLGRSFAQNYWLFIERAADFTVTARDDAGRTVAATLAGVVTADRAKNTNPVNASLTANIALFDGPRNNISLRFARDTTIGILKVRGFEAETFPVALDSVFRLLREKGTKSVILDLRGNGGGVDLFGARLVGSFLDKPFRYFDRIHLRSIRPSFATWKTSTFENHAKWTIADPSGGWLATPELHGGVAERQPGATPFLGKLVVLLDGGTYSTAADVTATLHHNRRATFVGEESAGGYEGNTSGLNARVVLPHSGLRLNIMVYDYWNPVSPAEKGRGTMPDVVIQRRVSDLLRGVDPQMEKAVELARP